MPEKAAYQRLESDAGFLFTFQLAEHLHKTRAEILLMDNAEIVEWNAYLLREKQLQELRDKQAKSGR